MLYDLSEQRISPYLLDLFEIDAGELPAVAAAHSRAGALNAQGAALTGLAQGTPLAVGTGDDFSNLLGAGVVEPGRVVCTLGTAEVVGALHPGPLIDSEQLVETHGYAGGQFFIENPGWLSGGALQWFAGSFRIHDMAELDALAAAAPAAADGLLFVPALSGAMAPQWIAAARGCYYGLTPAHDNRHLARATLEGCAWAMRDVLERLLAMGVACDTLLLLGGGAHSRLWAQIRADISGLPVQLPQITDTSPLGAALLAAVAAGVYDDLASAAACVGTLAETLQPDPQQRARYDQAYGNYRKLFDCLRPMFQESA
jgi:xylulokinase